MNKNILVIEEAENMRRILFRLYENHRPYDTLYFASNVQEAIAMLVTTKPDLILTDLSIEGICGFDFVKKVRSHSSTKDIPVIIISSESQMKYMEKGKEAGANGWLVRPINPESLENFNTRFLDPT